jgi:xanthine dehydrogenase accessory factor
MFDRFLDKASQLRAAGQSFAVAVVVRYQAPISGKPGDKAIITADGKMWGWIGGGCAQPVVVKVALQALADGKPRLIRISPSSSPENGIANYDMTCHSGGTVDIFIEPVLPKPHLLILGRSPIAQTLAKLGNIMNYAVSVAATNAQRENFPGADMVQENLDLSQIKITPQTFIVVSTQGEDDEEALEKAVTAGAQYTAFVASRVKSEKVFEYLRERGIAEEKLTKVRAPAGLDIHAASPEEIAVSILAEIIQVKGTRTGVPTEKMTLPLLKQEARDPICGMMVDVGGAKYKSDFRGNSFYFCCPRCKQTFDQQPEKYSLVHSQ